MIEKSELGSQSMRISICLREVQPSLLKCVKGKWNIEIKISPLECVSVLKIGEQIKGKKNWYWIACTESYNFISKEAGYCKQQSWRHFRVSIRDQYVNNF